MSLPSARRGGPAGSAAPWRSRVLFGAVLVYLAASAVYVGIRGVDRITEAWPFLSDFNYFYHGGMGLRTDPSRLYEKGYYYPPLLGALYVPLTFFPVLVARHIAIYVSALLAACLLGLTLFWTRGKLALLAATLAVASCWPLYLSIEYGQPSLLFALLYGVALVTQSAGQAGFSAVAISLLAMKPSLLAGPFAYLVWLGNRRAILIGAAVLVAAFFLPLAVLGWDTLRSYIDLLIATRKDAFTLSGIFNSGPAFMFNWNGFWARLLVEDPPQALIFPCYLVTVALLLKVWSRGSLLEGWVATSLATVLVTPHLLFYDWVMVLPGAIALAIRRPRAALIGLLLLLHLTLNLSVLQMLDGGLRWGNKAHVIFAGTPAALLVIAYLAFEKGDETAKRVEADAPPRRAPRAA